MNIKYIKIKDLDGRYSLSETTNGVINVKDNWETIYPSYGNQKKTTIFKISSITIGKL